MRASVCVDIQNGVNALSNVQSILVDMLTLDHGAVLRSCTAALA